MDIGTLDGERIIREGINWPCLEALVGSPEEDCYHELVEHDAYAKLRDLRAKHLKQIVICPRSKRGS